MKLVRCSLLALFVLSLTAACGSADGADAATPASADARASQLRLGYFANVTHASAVYGVGTGSFQQALGSTELKTAVFTSGPAAIEAMRGGALDATFIGPNPAINGFTQTDGKLLRIVAGTTSGGAALVVSPEVSSVEQLAGKKIATPKLGNTQDVAAKTFFAERGVDVDLVNQENAQTLDLLQSGDIDGAWVPEPWASRLVLDGGAKVLVDEASLWPAGDFVTTQLVVRQKFLRQYPGTVQDLLKALLAATETVATKSEAVLAAVNGQIEKETGKALTTEVLVAAFANLRPTVDPVADSLARGARNAQATGLLGEVDLRGIYDLRTLNRLLRAAGLPAVNDAGLGVRP